jgi:[acyl-carrier-protein] S-malonyltransferase
VRASSQDVASYFARNLDEFSDGAGPPRDLASVADDIERSLTASHRRRCFVEWLDRRRAVLVHLEPGHEHPSDPSQPDATHRH